MLQDDMDRFVEEQKAKLAEERRNLEMNPTSAVSGYYTDRNIDPKNQVNGRGNNGANTQQKAFVEDSPPVNVNTRPATPKIFKLGEDYQKFRNQLNQQRQKDYVQQLNRNKPIQPNDPYQSQQQVQTARPTLTKQSSDLGLSLPIRDHLSAQERLRRERNREYNDLLQRNQRGGARSNFNHPPPPPPPQQQQQTNNNRPRDRPPPAPRQAVLPSPSASGRRRVVEQQQQNEAADRYTLAARREPRDLALQARLETEDYMRAKRREIDDSYNETLQRRQEAEEYAAAKKREADDYVRAKLRDAESYQELLDRKRAEERFYRKDEDFVPVRVGPPGVEYVPVPVRRRPRRRGRPYYDEDYDDDYYDALDEELYHRLKNRRPRVIRIEDDDDGSSLATPPVRVRKDAPRSDKRKLNSAEAHRERTRQQVTKETYDASYDTPGEVRSKSAPPEQEFTGLPIGERENYATATSKKEQYRRELEQQMKDNKQKKINDRNRDRSEERVRERAAEEFTKPKRVTYADERDDRRGGRRRSDSEGDIRRSLPPRPILNQSSQPPIGSYRAPPTAAPPPQANDFVSPHDQAYFYYGARNPLDPSFGAGVPPPPTSSVVGASYPPPITPLVPTTQSSNARNTSISPSRKSSDLVFKSVNGNTGLFQSDGPQDNAKQQKAQSYQEELRRQVEDKRREKERRKAEEERYDRRKDAEAREYNPWGKGGGGAPMRDLQGNLVYPGRKGFNPHAKREEPEQQRQDSPSDIDSKLAKNSIADLRQMRQTNDDLSQNPTKYQQQQQQAAIQSIQPLSLSPRYNDTTETGATPRFGRSNPFENKETAHQKSQKDLYKEELQRQIDERKRVEAEKKEQLRLEEEKEEKRLQEQNKKMQEEFEAEQRRKQEKIEEQKRKNEELQRAIEDQKLADKQKRRDNLTNQDEAIRRQRERELDEKLQQATPRQSVEVGGGSSRKPVIAEGEKIPRTPVGRPPPSNRQPPQPSNRQSVNGGATYRQPTTRQHLDTNRRSQKISARPQVRTESPLQAPARETPRYIYSRDDDDYDSYEYDNIGDEVRLPGDINSYPASLRRAIYAKDSSRISRELSALRRQLLDEQRRIEDQLGNESDFKINTQQIQDLSRLRQRPVQVVRRPRPLAVDTQRDVPDQMALKEFNDFKYKDDETSSLRIFKSEYPEQPVDSNALEKQQAQLIRNQVRNLESLKSPNQSIQKQQQPAPVVRRRQSSPPPPPIQRLEINYPPPRTASPNSLLETETTYIPISDDLPPTPEPRQPARERRRVNRVSDKENKNEVSVAPSLVSMTISDVELLAGRNQKRLAKLEKATPAEDAISLADPDDILNRFVNKHDPNADSLVQSLAQSKDSKKRSASITTLESEPWLRPESRTT